MRLQIRHYSLYPAGYLIRQQEVVSHWAPQLDLFVLLSEGDHSDLQPLSIQSRIIFLFAAERSRVTGI